MKLVSVDVGIKNMAYCVFEIQNDNCFIVDWNIINLMNREPEKKTCTILKKPKSTKQKNAVCSPCDKKAKYEKDNDCFCETHAKMSGFILPKKSNSPSQLKKLKLGELETFAKTQNIHFDQGDQKKTIYDKIIHFLDSYALKLITTTKTSAGELDLITIGRNLKTEFDKLASMKDVTHIVIENQISPIATRMKTIQGMLAQYFIMQENEIVIEFVSSSCKLKGFEKQNVDAGTEYKQHKKDSVYYCEKMLENENFSNWKQALETKKKDDLADCFLQGIWYLRRENKILIA
jgi:hypothetical protein